MPGDANETFDIFVKDLRTGRVTLASANADGDEGDSFSFAPSISANGRHVAFHSAASNLVPGDTNRAIDVFVKDLLTGEVALASADVSGNQGDGSSAFASISANGRLVAFQSSASNLARGDDNRATDVFVKNLETGALTLASVNERGTEGDSGSFRPSISDNGRYVAFESAASNLVLDDTNGTSDIFLRDLRTGELTLVSVDPEGNAGNGFSDDPNVTDEGVVAFQSAATNLVPGGDFNGFTDIFIRS